MKVSIVGECYVLDAKASTENEKIFLKELQWKSLFSPFPSVNFFDGKANMTYSRYGLYKELAYLRIMARKYGIELDESVTSLLEKEEKAYKEIREKYMQEDEGEQKELCGKYCMYCVNAWDGDLYCNKYQKYLDLSIGEHYDGLTDKHYLYASQGIKLAECKVEERVKEIMNKGERSYV